MTASEVEALCKLVVQYELESIECDGVKVVKKLHRVEPVAKATPRVDAPEGDEFDEDDVLFASTRAGRMTVEDLARMAEKTREPEQ